MKAVIVEDERFAAERLEKMIIEIANDISIIAKIESVEEAVDWFAQNQNVDLIFMDIHLADGSCFEIFNQIKITSPVIFTTAYDQYALKAFEVNSISYLLKPIDKLELEKAIIKFKNNFQSEQSFDFSQLASLIQNKKEFKNRFLLNKGQTLVPVEANDVAYFVMKDGVLRLVTKNNDSFLMNQKLEDLESQLDPFQFFRLNRQFLVHAQSVKKVHNYFNGKLKVELEPTIESEVLVSRLKASEFKKWLGE